MASFRLTRDVIDDLDAIWLHIYKRIRKPLTP